MTEVNKSNGKSRPNSGQRNVRTAMTNPKVSFVIPVFNEEAILHASVVSLIDRMKDNNWSYEIIIAENGSTDGTAALARELSSRFDEVNVVSYPMPNYGAALLQGIRQAQGEYVICEEIDLCDTDFHKRAIDLLESQAVDMVIGSKAMPGSKDDRPWLRHAGTLVMNQLLRLVLGFKGTDTHGLKAFRRERLLQIANRCVVDRDLFASELVIRAERDQVSVLEIPVHVLERRPPSVHLFRRVPHVLKNLARLWVAIKWNS